MGYSDNTNLVFLLTTLCDTAAVYGLRRFLRYGTWHESIQDALDLLRGKKLVMKGYDTWEKEPLKSEENPLVPYHLTEKRILCCFPEGDSTFSGRLIGGCMDCLVNLTGTSFDKVAEFQKNTVMTVILWFWKAVI